MKKISIYLATLAISALVIYSCAKEPNTTNEAIAKNQAIELRGNSSACSPQTLYTEYSGCSHTSKNITISFTGGLSLYSNSSILHQLYPSLTIPVSYTFTKCLLVIGSTINEVHFIHNLTYDLNSMAASCPALKEKIKFHNLNGTLESFLDALDHDISMQVEFTEAYQAALAAPSKYMCENQNKVFYSVKYIKNTCYKWVLKGVIDTGIETTPGTGTGDANFVISQEDCGSSVCCARSTEYCVQVFENGEPNLTYGYPQNYQKFEGSCPEECTHDCGGPKMGPMTPSSETQIEGDI
ncbi:MAG: hypothetical protein LC107_05030 [Chitinophagales bacterium]|nr:hypothetical protein [Chitinophagales bacterium]